MKNKASQTYQSLDEPGVDGADGDSSESKRSARRVSLHPLKFEDALKALARTEPLCAEGEGDGND